MQKQIGGERTAAPIHSLPASGTEPFAVPPTLIFTHLYKSTTVGHKEGHKDKHHVNTE